MERAVMDAHPPFQIDGNFGATSGIVEMLLQSHLRDENGDFFQDILPALPAKIPNGNISGIKGRGNFEFSINWKKGMLISLRVKSLMGNKLILRYNGKTISRETITNRSYTFELADFQ
jgi:alpha-L-fucosidase 2